jgi:hypothetical protein
MRTFWKALIALSGHSIVLAGGFLFLAANSINFDLNMDVQAAAFANDGLKVMLQVYSLTMVLVGLLAIRASFRFLGGSQYDEDLPDITDPFYLYEARG